MEKKNSEFVNLTITGLLGPFYIVALICMLPFAGLGWLINKVLGVKFE